MLRGRPGWSLDQIAAVEALRSVLAARWRAEADDAERGADADLSLALQTLARDAEVLFLLDRLCIVGVSGRAAPEGARLAFSVEAIER